MLSKEGISHYVCVATGYGSDVMEKSGFATLHIGRMDADGMSEYLSDNGFSKGDTIVDATHPYATEAAINILIAADRIGCRLLRIKREPFLEAGKSYVNRYRSMKEFAGIAEAAKGNILLTTGSKDLDIYCENVSEKTLMRTYVRIIPAPDSMEKCESLGIPASHVIAAQGPFLREMNLAMIHQYDIKHIVTKDSGSAGGVEEKISAAADSGALVHLIDRPQRYVEGGLTVYEAYEEITGRAYRPERQIILAGAGPGCREAMTADVYDAVQLSDALFGAEGVIKDVPAKRKYEMYRAEDIIRVLEEDQSIGSATVLFSGDSGFYSGAKKAYDAFSAWDGAKSVTVLPGISSVSYMAAKLGLSYDDAKIVSLHADNGLHNTRNLVDTIIHNGKTFALVADSKDISNVAAKLSAYSPFIRIYAGRDLSGAGETIECMSTGEAERYDKKGKITALFINNEPVKRRIINCHTDDEFIREKVPMTKEIVRHESIARLKPCEGDLLLDIGGGTGSVAIEAAALDPSIRVITIEKDPEAVSLIRKNIEIFGTYNVSVVEGEALDIIPQLPCPDCVFIGGSGGKLSGIIGLLSEKGDGIRCVVNAVSLETIEETGRILREKNAKEVRCVQISVSDIEPVGEHHMMKANNPVTVFSFTL